MGVCSTHRVTVSLHWSFSLPVRLTWWALIGIHTTFINRFLAKITLISRRSPFLYSEGATPGI